jgi:hypothetical protein
MTRVAGRRLVSPAQAGWAGQPGLPAGATVLLAISARPLSADAHLEVDELLAFFVMIRNLITQSTRTIFVFDFRLVREVSMPGAGVVILQQGSPMAQKGRSPATALNPLILLPL